MVQDNDIVIIAAKRTAVGSHGGSLKNFSPTDLGVFAAQAALDQIRLEKKLINHIIFGNVLPVNGQGLYLPRHVGLRTGLNIETPALLVSRMCNSGYQAIISGSQQLLLNEAEFVLSGGSESMSQAPFLVEGHRWGNKLGDCILRDELVDVLTDGYIEKPMAITAEELAIRYKISREECDSFALESQNKAMNAIKSNKFYEELTPISIKGKGGKEIIFNTDEHPRFNTTLENLAKLKPVFKKDGVVTAGNASGIGDGAAAIILTTNKNARQINIKPLAKIISWGISGCNPHIMGIGVVGATKMALKKADLKLGDIDLFEINEAFASQYLAVEKELNLDRKKVNVNGGAIALAHPVGCTGVKLTITLLYELIKKNAKLGLTSACAGGGQGTAIIIENLT
jgi:acetyl-CoA acetyltransferase family protein